MCSIESCLNTVRGRHGLCNKHRLRLQRWGSTDARPKSPLKGFQPGNTHGLGRTHMVGMKNAWKEVPGYDGLHRRIHKLRGPAKNHNCVDCGRSANHWTYNHQDPNALTGSTHEREIVYSLDVMNYDPRCAFCHKVWDHK